MSQVEQTVYLISEPQRNALLDYLQNRPFKEVAAGIQFLLNAPTAKIKVDASESSEAVQVAEAGTAEPIEIAAA